MEWMKSEGIDLHAGRDAFSRCAVSKYPDIAKYLLEDGADIHAKNDEALRNAVIFGDVRIVRYLVEQGADIHADRDTPLRLAEFASGDIGQYLRILTEEH